MDAIVGEDPFKADSTPKWAACDKSVTQFDDQKPESLGTWESSIIGNNSVLNFKNLIKLPKKVSS